MVKQEKEKINLVLFLTLGGSLKQWHNAGILDRELALYKELKEKYNVSTSIISFGDKTEKQITVLKELTEKKLIKFKCQFFNIVLELSILQLKFLAYQIF